MAGRLTAAFLALSFGLAPAVASACSMAPGYRVPTNFELVRTADLILVARLVPSGRPGLGAHGLSRLEVQPVSVLKGELPESPLVIKGMLSDAGEGNGADYRPTFTALDQVHPNALAGACSRYMYRPDTDIVLMFGEHDGLWIQYAPAFARAAEDVADSEQALWVRTIKLYREIASLPPEAQSGALKALRTRLRAEASGEEGEIVADIDRALAAMAQKPRDTARP